jgi:hypothetical protein
MAFIFIQTSPSSKMEFLHLQLKASYSSIQLFANATVCQCNLPWTPTSTALTAKSSSCRPHDWLPCRPLSLKTSTTFRQKQFCKQEGQWHCTAVFTHYHAQSQSAQPRSSSLHALFLYQKLYQKAADLCLPPCANFFVSYPATLGALRVNAEIWGCLNSLAQFVNGGPVHTECLADC